MVSSISGAPECNYSIPSLLTYCFIGFNLASVIRFRSDDDRRYFVQEDPAHKELVGLVKDRLASGILVLDFIDGGVESVSIADC